MFTFTMKTEKCAKVSYGISSCHIEAMALLRKNKLVLE